MSNVCGQAVSYQHFLKVSFFELCVYVTLSGLVKVICLLRLAICKILCAMKLLPVAAEMGGLLSTETATIANFESQNTLFHETVAPVPEALFITTAFPKKKPTLLRYSAITYQLAKCSVPKFLVATLSMNFVFRICSTLLRY